MNDNKLFTQRIGLLGVTNVLVGLSGLILLPILTKNLTIEEYGVWVQGIALLSLIVPIAGLNLSGAIVRFLAAEKNKEVIKEDFYSIAVLTLVGVLSISFIIFLLEDIFATNFLDNRIDVVRILLCILPVLCLISLCLNFFRTFQEIKLSSLLSILQTYGIVVIVAFSILVLGYGIFGALVSYLIAQTIILFIATFIILRRIGIKKPQFLRMREYLTFCLPILPAGTSLWFVSLSDRYLIAYFLGIASVGYYAPGYGLGETISMYIAPIGFLLPVILSKYYDEGKLKDARIYISYTLKYFLLLAIPSVFGLSLLSRGLLVTLTTDVIGNQGYLIVPFSALSALLFGVYLIIVQIIGLVKKTKIIGIVWILAAALNLGLNFIFIPCFGIIGAAITTLIAYTFVFGIVFYYSFHYFKFTVDVLFILKSIVASIIMSLFLINMNHFGILNILISIVVSAVIYITVLFLIKGFTFEEIKFFRGCCND